MRICKSSQLPQPKHLAVDPMDTGPEGRPSKIQCMACPGVYADKILMERRTGTGHRKRQAVGVSALTTATSGGRQFKLIIKAKYVVSSAGALHTPALLLRSKITCKGNVGRHLHLHPATAVYGLYQKVRVLVRTKSLRACTP